MNQSNQSTSLKVRGRPVTWAGLMACMLIMLMLTFYTGQAEAAGFKTSAKPKFVVADSRFSNGNAILKWKKVKGAKQYVVYTSKTKNGTYKKFTTTKKLTITKKSSGENYFKVKAVSGKKSSKFSAPVHLFDLQGNIYNSMRLNTSFNFGGGRTTSYYYSAVKNNTRKSISFKEGDSCQFVQYNPKTGEIKKLETGSLTESVTIAAGGTDKFTTKAGYPTVENDTVLVIQVPFTAGGQKYTLNIGRDPVNTWVTAIKK